MCSVRVDTNLIAQFNQCISSSRIVFLFPFWYPLYLHFNHQYLFQAVLYWGKLLGHSHPAFTNSIQFPSIIHASISIFALNKKKCADISSRIPSQHEYCRKPEKLISTYLESIQTGKIWSSSILNVALQKFGRWKSFLDLPLLINDAQNRSSRYLHIKFVFCWSSSIHMYYWAAR